MEFTHCFMKIRLLQAEFRVVCVLNRLEVIGTIEHNGMINRGVACWKCI